MKWRWCTGARISSRSFSAERTARFCWHELAEGSGSGLRELLQQNAVLGEALHTCEVGLLRGRGVTLDNLRATGERVLVDIIEPLDEAAGEEPPAAPPSSR